MVFRCSERVWTTTENSIYSVMFQIRPKKFSEHSYLTNISKGCDQKDSTVDSVFLHTANPSLIPRIP